MSTPTLWPLALLFCVSLTVLFLTFVTAGERHGMLVKPEAVTSWSEVTLWCDALLGQTIQLQLFINLVH